MLVGVLALGLISMSAGAQRSSPSEVAVKATFFVKFASYLDWPAGKLPPGAPIILCVIGRDPFGKLLDRAAAGQHSAGHPIVVRRIGSSRQAAACHLAYLGGSGRDASLALSEIGARPIVTVTDARASSISGIIHFQMVEARVKFDVDIGASARAGVQISSKLLGLARSVRGEKGL